MPPSNTIIFPSTEQQPESRLGGGGDKSIIQFVTRSNLRDIVSSRGRREIDVIIGAIVYIELMDCAGSTRAENNFRIKVKKK